VNPRVDDYPARRWTTLGDTPLFLREPCLTHKKERAPDKFIAQPLFNLPWFQWPVNSLVGCSKFNNFAAQMTTHEDA
jgi:hypothetical protein